MIVIGTILNKGGFQARKYGADQNEIFEIKLDEAPEDSFEYLVSQLNMTSLVIDFRSLSEEGPVYEWFQEKRKIRNIGNTYFEGIDRLSSIESVLPNDFDILIYLDETSRAIPTEGAREKYNFKAMK